MNLATVSNPGQLQATWRNCLALLGVVDLDRVQQGAAGVHPK
jgi:hypothetical protein